jgi:hypothetical protein
MSESTENFGSGILKGLKKVLFNPDTGTELPGPTTTVPVVKIEKPAPEKMMKDDKVSVDDGYKDMKLKVYQLLENLNKPGIDFFEVWNAAVEMGGANSTNIKSAYTSLKYADKSLDKSKLVETGQAYINGLNSVIETEAKKRMEEKSRLDKEMENMKSSLDSEITTLEQQITSLQQRLTEKKSERSNIHARYEPKIAEIDLKINAGRQSVNSVLSEMQQVIEIIKKDLN